MIATLILALLSIFFTFSSPAAAATINVNCPADNLQTALNNANPGDTIVVSGMCTGNFLVRNDKARVFIQSSGYYQNNLCNSSLWATLDGGGSGTVLDIRGKAISVTCMEIKGGDNGIVVQRGSNAVLDQNNVHGMNRTGITIASSAFAAITNSAIFNNVVSGILVTESSSARIGWNSSEGGPAASNDIELNDIGILVIGSSSAAIAGNHILFNTTAGIAVWRGAHADASGNTIDLNGDGIWVSENSVVYFAGGAGIFALPNSTDLGINSGFGIKCKLGGNVNGSLGSLNGVMGQTSIDPKCSNNLVF